MARKRRRPGQVRDAVLRLVKNASRPVGALEIERMLDEEGEAVPANTVFRALRELVDRGAIRKIMVARGYAPGDGAGRIGLFCSACGTLSEVAGADVFGALDDLAAANGFAVSRKIVEVAGICPACASVSVTVTEARNQNSARRN